MFENYVFNVLKRTRRVFNRRKLFFAASLPTGLLIICSFLAQAASGNLAGVFDSGSKFVRNFTVEKIVAAQYSDNYSNNGFRYAGYFSAPIDPVNVSIPTNLSVLKGSALIVPINVSDTTGRGITSFDFRLNYDPNAFSTSPPFADTAGTLASGFEVNVSNPAPGTLIVSGFGTAPLAGSGVLLRFSLLAVSANPVCGNLGLPNFAFNEGDPASATIGGNACITIATVTNGEILFTSNRDGNNEIYKMNSGGSEQQRLTDTPENESSGKWSPDGRKILFSKSVDSAMAQIWVMNADGSNKILVSDSTGINLAASWSPNGQKILFSKRLAGGAENLWTMNADGTNKTRLTDSTMIDHFAEWSPDAGRIAFGRCNANSVCDVFTMNADGSNQTNLTAANPDDDDHPIWSNDGSKIIFGRGSEEFYNAFVMNANGTNIQNLTDSTATGAYSYRVVGKVSPDGNKAALIRTARIVSADYLNSFEVAAVNLDGSNLANLTNNSLYDIFGDWSPDGSQIVFTSRRDTVTDEIYAMNSDGSSVVRLTSNSAADTVTDWQSFASSYTAPTSAGQNVEVAAENFALNFDNISTPGNTVVTVLEPEQVPTVPSGFTISGSTLVYEIETTALFSGEIVVSFDVPDVADEAACSLLRVLHYTNGAWDTSNNAVPVYNSAKKICTVSQTVTSLSPFMITGLNSYSISGRISDGANPLSGAAVSLTGYSNAAVMTDASGNFFFGSLPEGQNFTVTPFLTNYTFTPANYVFNNLSANQTADFSGSSNCLYAIEQTSVSAGAGSGTGVVVVTAPAGCTWTAAANVAWLSITAGTTGNGNKTVNYSVETNTGAARAGTMTIAGRTFTVNQESAAAISYEGDINPRPNQPENPNPGQSGDGMLTSGDVTQMRRFVLGIDTPDTAATNEFQKADIASYDLKGDGGINAGDVTQIRRYVLGREPRTNTAGPVAAIPDSMPSFAEKLSSGSKNSLDALTSFRELRAIRHSVNGNILTVAVQFNNFGKGGVNSIGASINYDEKVLSNPTNIRLSGGAPAGISLGFNKQTERSSIGLLLDLAPASAFPEGMLDLVLIDFTILSHEQSTILTFGDQLTARFVSDANGNSLPTTFANGAISFAPTTTKIGGRAITNHGKGIRSAVITLTDSSGAVRTTTTSGFGFYRFENVAAGVTLFTAKAKLYTFTQNSQVRSVTEEANDINFVADSPPN